MTSVKVNAVGDKKGDEHFKRALNRPYYYGYSAGGKTIYAYTEEEWGLGASSGGGDHNLIRSFYFSLFLTVLVAPVSLFCLLLGIFVLFKLSLMGLVVGLVTVKAGLERLQQERLALEDAFRSGAEASENRDELVRLAHLGHPDAPVEQLDTKPDEHQ